MIARYRHAVLVLLSPKCAPCRSLLPEISRWQRSLSHELDILVISNGDPNGCRALAIEHGVRRMFLVNGEQFTERYRVNATPAAVLIDERFTIAAAPVMGAPGSESLIRVALERVDARRSAPANVVLASR